MRFSFKRLSVLFFALVLLNSAVFASTEAPSSVEATIASVTLEIDGQAVDNLRSLYPLLMYNDITYFPITGNYMLALGLEKGGDFTSGLTVKTGSAGAQKLVQDLMPADQADHVADSAVTADLRVSPIVVQGQEVQHLESDWPFLFYNDVTYMPATWEYMVTLMGLNYEYDVETRVLKLGGYTAAVTLPAPAPTVDGNKVTLADITRLKTVFDSATLSSSAQQLGLSAEIGITSYAESMEAATVGFNYDGIVDGDTQQILYTLIPDAATASKLNVSALEMYVKPNELDENRMQVFSKEGNTWKRSEEDMPLTAELFVGAATAEDTARLAGNLERMGLMNMADAIKDPGNASKIYKLYQNFNLDENADGTVVLSYAGTVDGLMSSLCSSSNETKARLYSSVMAFLGYDMANKDSTEAFQYFAASQVLFSSTYEAASGRLLSQKLDLDVNASATEAVASISMDVSYNYNPVLNWPNVD